LEQNSGFQAARPVADNPMTREHRDAPPGTIIKDDNTKDAAELFSHVYGTMLLMLLQYYSFAGEPDAPRKELKKQARMMMVLLIRPLGDLLTGLPMGTTPPFNAGAGFEIYGDLRVPADWIISWKVIVERLGDEVVEANRLAKLAALSAPARDALAAAARNLGNIQKKLGDQLPRPQP
jgi:hypothetical protein